MTAIDSMFNYLSKGSPVTSRQARTMFKVENIPDLVYRLRNTGQSVYTRRTVLHDGTKTFAYSLGEPTPPFVGYLKSGHLARARKVLYRDAITVRNMKG